MPDLSTPRLVRLVLVLALGAAGCASPGGPRTDVDALVHEATIAGLQAALREGRVRCTELVDAYLARIEAYDASTGLGAITEVNPRARERAAALDARLAAGATPGPLFCAPLLVKDNFDTATLPTTGGSVALAGSVPPDDAFQLRRLREAGAIVLAKTNMAEWAFSPRQTVSSSYGRTANAYALDRVPAGSSGGTASGVAASFGVAGLGSDTGNSIRGPSSHLALFGIRSTLGLTSRDGIIPLVFDRDVGGPMTRTVEDGARLFDVIAGTDPADPYTAEADARREPSYLDRLRRDGLAGHRIGVLRALVPPDTDPEVAALFEAALRQLAAAGATIVDPVAIADFEAHLAADNFCNRFRHDVAVYLDSLDDPPLRDVAALVGTDRVAPENAEALAFFAGGPLAAPSAWEPPCPEYADHPGRQAFLAAVTEAMDAAGVDALAYPSWTHPPAHLDRADEEYRGDNSQRVAPATGMPAVTVPMGFTRAGTLPAGLQLLGRRWDDGLLIQFAYAYEQATRHRRPPPAFPPLVR
ncbi:MAG: amidase family protein [Pseudomonadales bacterium]|nr:amidase family protein [Pseudomonadales bacterium]